jgi:predicted nucleotidyltransferase
MNIFYDEHRLLLKTLLDHHVDFILIGGYAVNYYGYNRVTGDMDLWLQPSNDNKERMLSALRKLGFDDEGISTIRNWDFTTAQKFYVGVKTRPDRTEFMTHVSGISYETGKQNLTSAEIDGLWLPIISMNNLIRNKESTGRLKDQVDIEYLKKIMELKTKDPG